MQARNLGKWLVGSTGVLALVGAGSASAQPDEVQGTCSNYELSPSEATLSSEGGSGTLDITWDWEAPPLDGFCIANCTSASCGEQTGSVRSSATWLTGTKDGDDQVDYTVAGGYGEASSRTATLTVAGATFTVTQQPPGPCPSSPDLLAPTSTSFPAAASVRYVSVTGRSDCSWPVSADQGWLTTPTSVSGGDSVRVQADENPGGAREGTVAIGGSSVSVSQVSGCPTAPTTVSPSSLSFPAAGGTQRLSVTGPAGCSWPVSDDQAWIIDTPTSVSSGGSVTVTVLSGHAGESGTVTIGSRDIPVSVTRMACPRTPDSVTPSSLTFPWPGGTQYLTVTGPAHCSWSVSDDQAWITATPSTVSAGNMVEVRVTPGPPGRSGTVTIGGTDVPVTVEPCPTSPTRVSRSSLRFPPAGGTESLSVTGPTGCSWLVGDNQAWIATTPSRVSDGEGVTVTVVSGSGGGSGTVTIGSRTIPIIVDPCPASPTGVTPTSLTFASAAGSRDVTVVGPAGCSWPVTASDTWTNAASSASAGSFAIGVDRNDGPRRTGTVTFGANGIVTVTQEPVTPPACPTMPRVSSTSVSLGGSVGDTAAVRLLEAQSCRYEVREGLTWLGAPSPVAGNALVMFTADEENGTGAARRGTVTIRRTGSTGGTEVTVTQEPVTPPPCPASPMVSSTSVRLGGSVGDTATVRLLEAQRCPYEVGGSLSWLGAAPSPVAGDALVTFTAVEENDTGAERTGTVMIGGVGGRTVTVTQDPVAPPLCPTMPRVSSTSVGLGASAGDTATVRLLEAPGCRYDVGESLPWLGAAPSPVAGDGLVTLTALTENDTSAGRPGTVMIGGVGGTAVTVTQDPVTPPLCPTMPRVSSTSVSLGGSAGDTGTVRLLEAPGCRYDVGESLSWLGAAPSPVAGNGLVTLTALTENDTSAGRPGTVMIGGVGGRAVTVTQGPAAPRPCPTMPMVSSTSVRLDSGDDETETVRLREAQQCRYTVSESLAWLSVDESPPVAGNATVTFRTEGENDTGAERSGKVMIGSTSVTATQGPAACPGSPGRILPSQVTAPDTGVTFIVALPDVTTCIWEVNDNHDWLATNKSRISGREKLAVTVEPNGDPASRTGTVTIGSGVVRIDQNGLQPLTARRDDLLEGYALRKGYGDDVCTAWDSFRATGQEVFIWNTHRLSHTGLLPHVEELHAVYGKGHNCGGGEFNRTFMTMTQELQRKLIEVYYGRDSEFRHWRKTEDFACSPGVVGLACGAKPEWCNCPHRPFNFQIETHAPWPRGQLNFFYPADYSPVDRSYFVGEQFCHSEIRWVTSDRVCEDGESCACGSGDCPRETPGLQSCRATAFRDVPVPVPAAFERGPAGDRLTIPSSQRLMFEMDQDYNGRDLHDSAPSCSSMKHVYTVTRGNPGWDWQPSDCHDRVRPGFSDGNLTAEASEIRAPHMVELRQRIDAQREFVGLNPFSWTDSTIVAGVTAVKAVHLMELRTALVDAYFLAGLATPTFTDGSVVAGITPIRVVHLSELLEAVAALEAQP